MAAGVVSAPFRMTDIMDSSLNPTLRRLLGLCRLDRTWVRGEGVWLSEAQGRRFLDCYAQYGAVALGEAS